MGISKLCFLFLIITTLSCGGNTVKHQNIEKSSVDSSLIENVVSFEIKENRETKKLIGTRSLGNATSNEILNDNFTIINTDDKVAVILDITTNCGCVTISYDKKPIKKDEKSLVKYSYNTRGKSGTQLSEITIKTNIGNYAVLVDLNIN